jgi:hypothetical protein
MRLRPADLLACAGGAVLLVSLFLTWYGRDREAPPSGDGLAVGLESTGWQALTVIDVLLAAAALVAVAVPVVTAAARGPAKAVALDIIGSVTSALAVLLVLWRLIDAPADGLEVRSGAWIGLAGALIALAGCFLALKDERAPGVAVPAVPVRPAPPA